MSADQAGCNTHEGKRTGLLAGPSPQVPRRVAYDDEVIELAMVVNSLFSVAATNRMAATTTIEMHAARSAYSMRSWPSVSRTNRVSNFFILTSPDGAPDGPSAVYV
jgi:hypothetical protein